MTSLIKYSLFLLLALASGCYANKKYRFDYEWSNKAGGWLKYHAVPTTWDKARVRCHAEGAILASPLTETLKAAIVTFVQNQKNSNHEQGITIFSGVHSIFSEGDYSSIEGVPLLRLAIAWEAGEPDNHENSERCLSMMTGYNGTMADTRCDRVLPYVCYKKDAELNMTECGTIDPEYQLNPKTGSCYKFHTVGLPWSEAYMTCVAEGGYLAVINNDMEAQEIKKLFDRLADRKIFAKFDKSVFIGFHDWGHYGTSFSTIQGESLEANFHSWADGQPDNATWGYIGEDRGEYCGSVTRAEMLLNDSYCNHALAFLCEKNPHSLA